MDQADSVHSTPPTNSSSNPDTSNIVKFPVGVSRKEFLRKAKRERRSFTAPASGYVVFPPTDDELETKEAERDAIRVAKREAREAARENARPATAINSDLRKERREDWRHADRVTDYWRARLDWQSALGSAQRWGIADSAKFPAADDTLDGRWGLVHKWREALVKQLLTPAPDLAAVTWKRAKIASRDFAHLPTKLECIERVIAEDLEWLAAHPTKRTGNKAQSV